MKIISFISIIVVSILPIIYTTNTINNFDIYKIIFWIIIDIGYIYFLYKLWERNRKFDSEVQYILNSDYGIEEKYKYIKAILIDYLNLK